MAQFDHLKPNVTSVLQAVKQEAQQRCDSSYCCDSRSYCVWLTVYWQTIKPVSATSWRTAG